MEERRSGEDRRAEPRTTPERRRGRPPLSDEERGRTIPRVVKLPSKLETFVEEMSARYKITKHAVIVRAVKRLHDIHLAAISGSAKNSNPPDPS